MNKIDPIVSDDDSYEFVQLDRTFHELSKYASEDDNVDIGKAFHVGEQLGWGYLTKEFRVVILSEAGSGKTEEIRNVARRLRGEEKHAFFLRLEHMPTDFEVAFEVGDLKGFQEWLAGGEEGWLLLDSVDEARLRNPRDFELAIRKLGRLISSAKDRAHIVITGRTTAWRPKTDLAYCVAQLPYTPPATSKRPGQRAQGEADDLDDILETETQTKQQSQGSSIFKIVALDDLSAEQIAVFVKARGIDDSKAFTDAVERADAWSFTARPQDLEELAAFWIDSGRIGSRLEIMRNSIDRRLTERDQGRADAKPLATERARRGARLLAAAAMLTQDPTIRVPDGADNAKGIPVQSVLPDWDDKDQSALLSRPIFDEAIYGAVRFHHRSVREYLMAEWLAELLKRETSRRAIEGMFFRNQHGIEIVVPTLRPILPWLILLDDRIRERVRKVAPEIVFEGGDPSQLPLEVRRYILQEVCEQIADGTGGRSAHDYAAVQRFANEDLTDDVRALLGQYEANDELTSFLLQMVWLGQLSGALPEARDVALSPTAERYRRITAFRAMQAIGSESDKRAIRDSFSLEGGQLRRDWLAELMDGIVPTDETVSWLLKCLENAEEKERFSVDQLIQALGHFVAAADLDLLPTLINGLNRLLDTPPVIERRFCEVSEKFEWLLASAANAVERLAAARHPASLSPDALDVIRKLVATQGYGRDELSGEKYSFGTLVPKWADLNRALFWFSVEQTRERLDKKKGERLTESWQVSLFGTFWRFEESDIPYVVEQINERELQDDKLVALTLAFELYRNAGRPRQMRESLKRVVRGSDELSERLGKYLNPPAQGKRRAASRSSRANGRSEMRSGARRMPPIIPAGRNTCRKTCQPSSPPARKSRTKYPMRSTISTGRPEADGGHIPTMDQLRLAQARP